MRRFAFVCAASVLSLGLAVPSFAARKPDPQAVKDSLQRVQLQNLQNEVDALERIRLEKADALEKKDAEHWRNRYQENKLSEDHDAQAHDLDARYSKLSTDLGRVSEELTNAKAATNDFKDKADAVDAASQALNLQVEQTVEKTESDIAGDYPVNMESRLLTLSKAKSQTGGNNPNTLGAMRDYLSDAMLRHEFTYTQDYSERNSQVGNRAEVPVMRLRLGTVFLGEVARGDSGVQALLRTGSLQGKIFEWNSEMPAPLANGMRNAVFAAGAGKTQVALPMDVLQNKAVRNTTSKDNSSTREESFRKWFHDGGIVMYPLALVAILALLLCMERFLTLTIRGRTGNKFLKKFYAAVDAKNYDAAMDLCLARRSSLSLVLLSIVRNADKGSDAAERGLKEAMLREQPKLEKRMGLLAALGTIAPLLGLLGTVTGIITLFTVITQVGTNDARILAGGISEALITTEAGLVIAIPVMVIHGFLSEKIEKVMSELYIQSTVSLNKIFPGSRG